MQNYAELCRTMQNYAELCRTRKRPSSSLLEESHSTSVSSSTQFSVSYFFFFFVGCRVLERVCDRIWTIYQLHCQIIGTLFARFLCTDPTFVTPLSGSVRLSINKYLGPGKHGRSCRGFTSVRVGVYQPFRQ